MNLLQKAAGAVVRLLYMLSPGGWHGDVGGASRAGPEVNERSALGLSAVWGCVNLLSGTTASLPLMVYRTDRSGRRTEAKDHPLYRILHDSPNYDQTAMDFWEGGCAALELRGNLYAKIERIGARVVALSPIYSPVDVRRVSSGGLRYRWNDGQQFDLPQEDVFHVRGFGGSPLGGLSTLSVARDVLGLAMAVDEAAGTTFRNGLRPSGVLSYPAWLKPEQRQPLEEGLQNKFAGAMNAGRPMVLEGGVTWQQLTILPEDAQMLESRGFSVEEICRFFGVPPFMIGHTEKTTSWGTGLSEQVLGFQKFTLRKRLKRIEMAIAQQLFTPEDRAAGLTVEFNLEGLLRADTAARFASYAIGLQNGIYVINECRGLENLPPVEGGDVPRMQSQNIPITQAGAVQQPPVAA